jgi:hypothetical protein
MAHVIMNVHRTCSLVILVICSCAPTDRYSPEASAESLTLDKYVRDDYDRANLYGIRDHVFPGHTRQLVAGLQLRSGVEIGILPNTRETCPGSEVIFYGTASRHPFDLAIGAEITVHVQFTRDDMNAPKEKLWVACVLGILEKVDLKSKTIYIKADPSNWLITENS